MMIESRPPNALVNEAWAPRAGGPDDGNDGRHTNRRTQ